MGTGVAPTHILQKADTLFSLSKEALKRNAIDELWRVKAATSGKSLGAVILSDTVMDQIRKELRRQTGHNMDSRELSDPVNRTAATQLVHAGQDRLGVGL